MVCPICKGPVWDNRPKKATGEFSAKSPDFKCKDKSCNGVIWPNDNPKTKEEFLPEEREPIKERDYDAENRGKIRHGIICAIIQYEGMTNLKKLALDDELKDEIKYLVEFVMEGK